MCFTSQVAGGDSKLIGSMRGTTLQQDLYSAVSAASSWLDAAENQLLSGPVLLSEDTETQLTNLEVQCQYTIIHSFLKKKTPGRNMLALTLTSAPLFRVLINS